MSFDIEKVRADFPILQEMAYNKQIVYLDNGATTQKPRRVIDGISRFYETSNSNVHRGVHYLSNKATECYESARTSVKNFINAAKSEEIIFTSGTTDAINTVAFSFGEAFMNEGDEILVTHTEHHSNIVPWQMLCKRKNAKLIPIPVLDSGELDWDAYIKLLNPRVKMVAISQVSNAFGTIFPVDNIIREAHEVGAKVLIDGAQGVQHVHTDVQASDMDFYVFSGHKIYAETGVGVLYGKEDLLEKMPPFRGGGDMIKSVSFKKTEYADLPLKFEAGTANYVGAISVAESMKYMESVGTKAIHRYEAELVAYANERLSQIDGLKIYGTAKNKTAAISFLLDGIHFYDTGLMLDKEGIALRTGTHCAEPGMARFGVRGTVRPGFTFYNTKEEVDLLVAAIEKIKRIFT